MPDFLVFIIGILIVFVIMVGPRWWTRRQGMFKTGKTLTLQSSQQVRDQVESLLVELQEINREVIARLDNKIRVLETNINRSEEILAALKQQNEQLEQRLVKARRETAKLPHTNEDASLSMEAVPNRPAGQDDPDSLLMVSQVAAAIHRHHEKVYALQDAGKDTLQIAEEMGMQRGEIDFILRLRP